MNPLRRWLCVALAVVAAAAFALSVGGGRWWSIGDAFEIGPLGTQQCAQGGGECQPAGFVLDAGPRFERAATATAAAGLIAMVILLGLAGAFAAGRAPRLLMRMVIVALATAAGAGALFVAWSPALPGASVDRGLVLYAAAIVAGAAMLVVARPLRS